MLLVVLVDDQGRRGRDGRVQQLAVRLAVRLVTGASGGGWRPRPQLVEVADHVVARAGQPGDQRLGLLLGPGVPVGGQHQPSLAWPLRQGPVRDALLDRPHVEPVGHLVGAGQGLVQPPQELGLGQAEGGVGPGHAEVRAVRVHADQAREPLPEHAGAGSRWRGGDHVDPLSGHVPGPDIQDGQGVVDPPEPPLAPVGGHGLPVDHVAEPVLPAPRVAVLDRFLPLRGQQRRHVPHGQHDVHLGGLQRAHRVLGLRGIGGREQLVRDDRGPRRVPGLVGQDVPLAGPRPGRVAGQLLDAAKILAGPEMVLRMVPRQHDTLRGQRGAVAPHDLLQEGSTCLRLADVQVDRCHPDTLSVVGDADAGSG